MKHNFQTYVEDRTRHGLLPVLRASALKFLRRTTGYSVMQGIRWCPPEMGFPKLLQHPPYACGFLTAKQLESASACADNELPPSFIQGALAKADACYGIFDGGVLAAYSWYSTRPTLAEDGLQLSVDPSYVYMYKAFTHPRYRGLGLNRFGIQQAVSEYVRRGFKGMVCYVRPQNLSSKKSFERLGGEVFGSLRYFAWGGYIYHSSGCKEMRFKATRVPQGTRLLNKVSEAPL